MRHRILTASLFLLVASAAVAQTTQPSPQSSPSPQPSAATKPAPQPTPTAPPLTEKQVGAKKKYEALLEKAKKGEGAIDFTELRMAYFESPDYNPLKGMFDYRAVWSALRQGVFPEAARAAELVLEKNFVDANAHMVAHVAYRETGNQEKAQLHRKWADGLINSIKSSGDGKTPATAFVVISISEEYALFRSMNVNAAGQSLLEENGHKYDVMKVVDPRANTEATLYFNVDKPFSMYTRK